ncbi:MAG: hypothetical protein AVDCRST_MAG56-345, partial [uncultured Cytophagales bacterium]
DHSFFFPCASSLLVRKEQRHPVRAGTAVPRRPGPRLQPARFVRVVVGRSCGRCRVGPGHAQRPAGEPPGGGELLFAAHQCLRSRTTGNAGPAVPQNPGVGRGTAGVDPGAGAPTAAHRFVLPGAVQPGARRRPPPCRRLRPVLTGKTGVATRFGHRGIGGPARHLRHRPAGTSGVRLYRCRLRQAPAGPPAADGPVLRPRPAHQKGRV